MFRILGGVSLLLAFLLIGARATRADEFYIASWNVENLFDLEDDPDVEMDEDFTPEAPKRWTAERLETKLKNLASVISKMNEGRGPDVLGLCEVENRKVVEMLVKRLAPLGRKYEIVHKDSPSDRGIDCALVFDANLFALADSQFHFVDAEKTRDIIEARLRRDEADLFVFVNHWPSRNNEEWQRIAAATVLRKRLDEILSADAKADIIMVGDFNDEPDNVSVKDHLRALASQENLPSGALYNTTARIRAGGDGTFVWDNKWQLIDQIIISAGLLDEAGYHWKSESSDRLEYPELFFQPSFPEAIPRPSKSYSEVDFHENGYSDHLAVGCVIAD
ncbi:MAG: endonuclease/exonuclease/phosphatase family protein [Pirellulales bacterium]